MAEVEFTAMEMIQVHYVYVSLLLHIIHMSIYIYFHVETEYLRVKTYSKLYSEKLNIIFLQD